MIRLAAHRIGAKERCDRCADDARDLCLVGRAAEEPVPGAPTAEAVEPGAEVAAAAPAEGAEEKEKPKEEKEKKK